VVIVLLSYKLLQNETGTMHKATTLVTLTAAALMAATAQVDGFMISRQGTTAVVAAGRTQLHMGLFDGVKEAFGAPALERSTIAAERETPIDRWMGWTVVSDNAQQAPPMIGT
jgi:hypothetical protein